MFEIKSHSVGNFRYNYDTYRIKSNKNNAVFFIQDNTLFKPGINHIHSGIYPFRKHTSKLDFLNSTVDSPHDIVLYNIFVDKHGEIIFQFDNLNNDPFLTIDPIHVFINLRK